MSAAASEDTEAKKLPHFETQADDEEVVVFSRAHFFTNFWWIVLTAILILIPPALKLVFTGDNTFKGFNLTASTQLILIVSWYLFVFAFAFQRFLVWFFNVYIVTNKRIVDVDFFNLFYKQISSTTIDNIQDVTQKRGGVAQLLFNYGDLVIETAGENPSFEFTAIPNPNLVQKTIINLLSQKRKRGGLN